MASGHYALHLLLIFGKQERLSKIFPDCHNKTTQQMPKS